MTIHEKIRDKKLQHNINRKAAKILALSTEKEMINMNIFQGKKYYLLMKVKLTLIRYRLGNIGWCKCGYDCKLMATFAKRLCLLLWLKSCRARGAFRYSVFMGNYLTISHTCSPYLPSR